MPYSPWWLWVGLVGLVVVIAWYAVVFVWTLPSAQLRRMPVIRNWHASWLRRRFTRGIRSVDERYRAGDLTAAQASAEMSRMLRSFLHQATGVRAQYMHVDDFTASDLAAAAPVLSALNDAQFNTTSTVNVSHVGGEAQELIRAWT